MQAMEQSELRQRVLEAIYSLPEHERSAVSLFYINGYSQAEVGEFLDVPAKTVKSRLHSARRKLRERMMDMVEDTLKKSAPDDDFAQRMVTLVRENLTLAGTGGRGVVDAADVVKRTLDFLRRFAPENVAVLTDLDQGFAQASALEIHLMVAPLCINGLQAMEGIGGELAVAVKTTQPMILGREHPNIKKGKDFVCISVRDTGVGMHSLTMQRMFDQYYTTRRQGQGFGQGLTTALCLAKSLGGEVAYAIHPSDTQDAKRGTTFEVYIPAGGSGAATEDGMQALDAALRATGEILAALASRYAGEKAIDPVMFHGFLMRMFVNGLLWKGESDGELDFGLETMRAGTELAKRLSIIEDGGEYLRIWVEYQGGNRDYAPLLRQWVEDNGLDSGLTRDRLDALLSPGTGHTRESEEEYFCLLGIVSSVAANLGGVRDLEARSDGGATFSLYLPTL